MAAVPLHVMMTSFSSHVMKTSAPSGEWMSSVSSHVLKASTLSYV